MRMASSSQVASTRVEAACASASAASRIASRLPNHGSICITVYLVPPMRRREQVGARIHARVGDVHQLDPEGRIGQRARGFGLLAGGRGLEPHGGELGIPLPRDLEQALDVAAGKRRLRQRRNRGEARANQAGRGEAAKRQGWRGSSARGGLVDRDPWNLRKRLRPAANAAAGHYYRAIRCAGRRRGWRRVGMPRAGPGATPAGASAERRRVAGIHAQGGTGRVDEAGGGLPVVERGVAVLAVLGADVAAGGAAVAGVHPRRSTRVPAPPRAAGDWRGNSQACADTASCAKTSANAANRAATDAAAAGHGAEVCPGASGPLIERNRPEACRS